MDTKKVQKILKVHNWLGTAICGCAGAIVGYILGGPFIAAIGLALGGVVAHFFQKIIVAAPSEQ